MKLKYRFEAVDMGDEIVAVPVGDGAEKVQGVLKLNREGQEIVELLKKDMTEEELVDVLAAKYENDRSALASYVHDTVASLRAAGLLEE